MEKSPIISVIMGVHKPHLCFLDESINSILSQRFEDFEFIIVIDGEKENNHVLNYVKENFNDSRLNLLINERNRGLTYSLNRALSIAKGKYIARMDADDVAHPLRLQKQFDYLEKNHETLVLGTQAKGLKKTEMLTPERMKIRLLFHNAGPAHPTVMFRNKEWIRYNLDYRTSQDYELWTRLIFEGKIDVLDEILMYYRRHEGQITVKKNDDQLQNSLIIRKRLFERYDLNITEEDEKVLRSLTEPGIFCNHLEIDGFVRKVKNELTKNKNVSEILLNEELDKVLIHIFFKSIKYKKQFSILKSSNVRRSLHLNNIKQYLLRRKGG